MSRYRTTEEIYHYDRFKLLVLLLLLAALLGLILFSDEQGLRLGLTGAPGSETEVAMATSTVDAVAGLPDTATLEPTAESVVATPELTVPIIATPLMIAPQPGTDLTAGEVIFAGTGEPNMTLRVLVDGQLSSETTIDAGGNWAVPVTLAAGSPQVMLATIDANGGVVAQSGPYVFNVAGGEVLPGEGSEGGDTGDAGSGSTVAPSVDNNSGPNPITGLFTLLGTAPTGSTIAVTVNGIPAGTTVADEQGNWSVDLVPGGGPLTVQIQVTDPAGTVTTTDPVTIEDPSGAPGLDLPGLTFPNVDTGAMDLTLPAGSFTWNGTGLPNTTVNILIDGQSVGVAPVNDQGNWTIDLDIPAGTYTVQLVTIDPTTGEPLGVTQVLPFTVVSVARPIVDVPAAGWQSGLNEISGSAPPGSTLTVFVNGNPVTDVTAGPDGSWTATIELPTGSSVIDVRLVGEDGKVVFGSEPLNVLVVGPEPTIGDVLVQAGQFNILLAAAQATGLDATLATGGPYTLFAPPDQAFTSLPAGVLDGWLANPAYLSTLLLHHIVSGEVSSEAAVQAGTLTTAAGDTLTISTEGTLVRVDSASILFPDVDASNGIVQVIDQVLFPALPPGVQGPVIDTAGVPTFTGPLLTVVGAAQPGYTILVQLNGQNFGQIATVDSTGFWLVSQDVTAGRYEIVAYMYDPTGILVGISDPVTLLVR